MIIRGGENIYPKEIESVLGRHGAVLRGGRDRGAARDIRRGAGGLRGHLPGRPVTAEELLALCRGNLTKIKIPTAIHIVPELPKNAVGKIDKPALRASRG